jgi:hypothetical protein
VRYVIVLTLAFAPARVALAQQTQPEATQEAARRQQGDSLLEFRGHRLGDQQWAKDDCHDFVYKGEKKKYCNDDNHQIGDLHADVAYAFTDKRLSGVYVYFSSNDFDPMTRAFVAKYGQPDSSWSEQVQNQMGATFQNTLAIWRRGRSSLLLQRYGSRLDGGRASLEWTEAMQPSEQAKDSAAQRAKRDL